MKSNANFKTFTYGYDTQTHIYTHVVNILHVDLVIEQYLCMYVVGCLRVCTVWIFGFCKWAMLRHRLFICFYSTIVAFVAFVIILADIYGLSKAQVSSRELRWTATWRQRGANALTFTHKHSPPFETLLVKQTPGHIKQQQQIAKATTNTACTLLILMLLIVYSAALLPPLQQYCEILETFAANGSLTQFKFLPATKRLASSHTPGRLACDGRERWNGKSAKDTLLKSKF